MKCHVKQLITILLVCCTCVPASAEVLKISLGIRETDSAAPIGQDGGTGNGIEWVDLDAFDLPADNQWHQYTFTPNVDPLTAFAGTTADGALDFDRGTIENIRFKSTGDNMQPWTIYIDDIYNTVSTGAVLVTDFEGYALDSEVAFQEPGFSGSTSGNLAGSPNFRGVTDETALSGSQSYKIEFQFLDDDPSRWLRLTTFNAANLPNPTVQFREVDFDPTISFSLKAVPEPSSLALVGIAGVGALIVMRRKRRRVS